jgi:hypothetical protein
MAGTATTVLRSISAFLPWLNGAYLPVRSKQTRLRLRLLLRSRRHHRSILHDRYHFHTSRLSVQMLSLVTQFLLKYSISPCHVYCREWDIVRHRKNSCMIQGTLRSTYMLCRRKANPSYKWKKVEERVRVCLCGSRVGTKDIHVEISSSAARTVRTVPVNHSVQLLINGMDQRLARAAYYSPLKMPQTRTPATPTLLYPLYIPLQVPNSITACFGKYITT